MGIGAVAVGIGLIPRTTLAQGWWFEAGPVFRGAMKINVAGPSYAQMGSFQPTTTPAQGPRDGIGSLNDYADRTYDNGYVNKPFPDFGDQNLTWDWGFSKASQYVAADSRMDGIPTLSFNKSYVPVASGGSDEMLGAGLHLLAGLPLKQSGNWSVDLTFGFQGVWGSATTREHIEQQTTTDRYDVSGITDPPGFPANGYSGTYLGPLANPGYVDPDHPFWPLIPNKPVLSAGSTAQSDVAFHVDQGLYQFSVGPQVSCAASSRLKLNLRPAISLNVINVDVQRTEVFVPDPAVGGVRQSWSHSGGQRQVLFGLGVTGGANLDLGRGFFTGVFGGYEWVAEKLEVVVGPNTVSVNASGFVAGAVVGKRF